MMGSTSPNSTVSGRGDWWELTNFDTNAISLRGYRFDDFQGVPESAIVITNDVIIQPGETVLFIQDMTPELFTTWWGEENLPENVQFVRYAGNGINATGDSITLWNSTALDAIDFIDRAEYVHLDLNFAPVRGISLSFWCDGFIEFGTPSVTNICGALGAAGSADLGSPGYVTNHPLRTLAPRFLGISRNAEGTHLTWKTQAGKRYELFAKDDLNAPGWLSLGEHTASTNFVITTDTEAVGAVRRFYRLQLLPELP
jgi:hypothetical protein